MEFITHQITVKGVPVWECAKCGKREHGRTVTFNINTATPDALRSAVNTIHRSNLPVGWSAFGAGGPVKCPECK